MKLRYPVTDLSALRSEREFFLRVRDVQSHAPTFANRNWLLGPINSKLEFNAALIVQAERAALGHLANDGAHLI